MKENVVIPIVLQENYCYNSRQCENGQPVETLNYEGEYITPWTGRHL
jgi:hypothetical protein